MWQVTLCGCISGPGAEVAAAEANGSIERRAAERTRTGTRTSFNST